MRASPLGMRLFKRPVVASVGASGSHLVSATGAGKSSDITVSNGNLRFASSATFVTHLVRADTATPAGTTTLKFTINAGSTQVLFRFGFDDGTTDFDTEGVLPGKNNGAGIGIEFGNNTWAIYSGNSTTPIASDNTVASNWAAGDVIEFVLNTSAHTAQIKRNGSVLAALDPLGQTTHPVATLGSYYAFFGGIIAEVGDVDFAGY